MSAFARLYNAIIDGTRTHPDPDTWRRQSADYHVAHAMEHLSAWYAGRDDEDHLGHALARVTFACEVVDTEAAS
jgi:hypothetical protein